jgi:hypothetical protein
MMLEGAPTVDASLIPYFVIWTLEDHFASIRYLCSEKFWGVPVFQSLEARTKQPIARNSKQGKKLIKQVNRLLPFLNEEYFEFTKHDGDCEKLPSLPPIQSL